MAASPAWGPTRRNSYGDISRWSIRLLVVGAQEGESRVTAHLDKVEGERTLGLGTRIMYSFAIDSRHLNLVLDLLVGVPPGCPWRDPGPCRARSSTR